MFNSVRRHHVLEEIEEATDKCKETLNRLVAKHCKLVGEGMKDIDKVIGERYALAKSTNIINHVWHIYDTYFQNSSGQSGSEPPISFIVLGSVQTDEGTSHCFSLSENQYCLVASNRVRSYLPNDYSDYYKLELKDQSGKRILAFRVHGDAYDKVTINRPSSFVEAFIPGDWIADFVAASNFHKALVDTQMIESLFPPEKVEARKMNFGIGR